VEKQNHILQTGLADTRKNIVTSDCDAESVSGRSFELAVVKEAKRKQDDAEAVSELEGRTVLERYNSEPKLFWRFRPIQMVDCPRAFVDSLETRFSHQIFRVCFGFEAHLEVPLRMTSVHSFSRFGNQLDTNLPHKPVK
jgi:hypothetical protein